MCVVYVCGLCACVCLCVCICARVCTHLEDADVVEVPADGGQLQVMRDADCAAVYLRQLMSDCPVMARQMNREARRGCGHEMRGRSSDETTHAQHNTENNTAPQTILPSTTVPLGVWERTYTASARPSLEFVPRPTSSMTTKDRGVAAGGSDDRLGGGGKGG